MSARPAASERVGNADAFLSRSDLRELGLERRAIDAVFRSCPVVAFPGYARTMVKVVDFLALLEASTYRNDEPRVRPRGNAA